MLRETFVDGYDRQSSHPNYRMNTGHERRTIRLDGDAILQLVLFDVFLDPQT